MRNNERVLEVTVEKSATENEINKNKNKKPQLIKDCTKTMINTLNTQRLQKNMENTRINRRNSKNKYICIMYTRT